MINESSGFDPYEAVLADLRARRDQLDQTIKFLEAQKGSSAAGATFCHHRGSMPLTGGQGCELD